MGVLEDILDRIRGIFGIGIKTKFVQYKHVGDCKKPCLDCPERHLRIYENNNKKPKVGLFNHPFCDCTYGMVREQVVGNISNRGIYAPDVYLKAYGKLPDYYITKREAVEKYGWNSSRNNLSSKAPGKMIGGDVFNNDKRILPEKEGRIWYECDVDYEGGARNSKRLYYSNDGLMFCSKFHDEKNVIFIY